MDYLANLIFDCMDEILRDKGFRFSIIMKFSLIGVQSGDSGGISATGEIPQERGFRDEEAHRAPHRTRPLGTSINNAYDSS